MKHLGEWIFDQRGRVVVAAFLLTLAALPFAGTVFDVAKQGGFDDPTSEAGHVETFLAEHEIGFPNADDLVLVIESPEARIQSVPIALEIRKLISAAIADPMVSRVTSRESLIKPDGLDAKDDMATLVLIAMRGTDDEKRTYYKEVLGPKLRSEIVQVRHSGLIPGNVELTETVVRDLRRAELIALPVTLVALLVLFGGIVPALLPIVIAGISLALSWGLTRILGQWIDISVLALTPRCSRSAWPSTIRCLWSSAIARKWHAWVTTYVRRSAPHRRRPGVLSCFLGRPQRSAWGPSSFSTRCSCAQSRWARCWRSSPGSSSPRCCCPH